MAECNLTELLREGACYVGLPLNQLKAIQLQLLCNLLGDGTFLGPVGPTGATGPTGADGPIGATGADGDPWVPTHDTLVYGATVTPDFAANDYMTVTLTGDIDFTASANRAAGKSKVIRVLCDGSDRTLAFNASWTFIGSAPANIVASKVGILTLTCFGANEADIVAVWAVEA